MVLVTFLSNTPYYGVKVNILSKEVTQALAEFGLSGNDVKALIALMKFGFLKASQLARKAGIPRPEIYRILKKLEERGLIQSRLEYPKVFKVIKPDRLVGQLLAFEKEKVAIMAAGKEELINALNSIDEEKVEEAGEEEGIRVLVGRQQVCNKKIELCKLAKNRIDYMVSGMGLCLAVYSGLIDVLRRRSKKIPVRIISEINEVNFREAELFSKFAELRQVSKVPFYLMIIDDKQAVVGIAIDMAKQPLNAKYCKDLWTDSQGWVRLYQSFFEAMWSSASLSKLADTLLEIQPPSNNAAVLKGEEGVWLVDASFNTVYVSRRTAEMLGYTPKEMVGKNLEEFCSQRWKKILHRLESRRRRGIKESHEFELLRKNGDRVKMLIHVEPIQDQDGRFTGTIAILREIA